MQVLSDQNVAPTLSRRLDERRKTDKNQPYYEEKKSASSQKCSLLIITKPNYRYTLYNN